ncbi:MAG: hypothetical protein SGPRY_010821, partial [Prymnesium sp.]
ASADVRQLSTSLKAFDALPFHAEAAQHCEMWLPRASDLLCSAWGVKETMAAIPERDTMIERLASLSKAEVDALNELGENHLNQAPSSREYQIQNAGAGLLSLVWRGDRRGHRSALSHAAHSTRRQANSVYSFEVTARRLDWLRNLHAQHARSDYNDDSVSLAFCLALEEAAHRARHSTTVNVPGGQRGSSGGHVPEADVSIACKI